MCQRALIAALFPFHTREAWAIMVIGLSPDCKAAHEDRTSI